MLNIILDTNMFVSAILYHGMVKIVFDLILKEKLTLYVSPDLKNEVLKKLHEFHATEQEINEALLFLSERGIWIEPEVKITVCRDPKDNFVLELAEASQADYIITRDKDLLDLHSWKLTKIMKPEEFLPLLRKMKLIK